MHKHDRLVLRHRHHAISIHKISPLLLPTLRRPQPARNRPETEFLIRKVTALPNVRAIFVTTDAAASGKREADEHVKAEERGGGGGYARQMSHLVDPGLCWDDIAWLRKQTSLPLCLKGVMSADDVVMAQEAGLDGVMLSNHGGRNLDTSPPALLVLLECHARFPHLFEQFHPGSPSVKSGQAKPFSIFVDGGVRRGTDILKCLCLGAVAVGAGRSFLFATGYGEEGVEHLIEIFRDELEVGMRNCGITEIEGCGPEYVNTGDVEHLVVKARAHPYAKDWRGPVTKLKARL